MLTLESSRLRLRAFQESDLVAFAAYRSDPEIARYQSWNTPYSLAQAIAFWQAMQVAPLGTPGIWYQLAVERQAHPGIIGDCAFQILADDHRQAHIGFTFARQFQKQGYATETVHCLLNYLFGERRLHRVSAICDADNLASAKLLERVGMRREAHLIENIWFKGAWGNEYIYALLDREWRAQPKD